jgi:hypothetical protein
MTHRSYPATTFIQSTATPNTAINPAVTAMGTFAQSANPELLL